MSEPKWTKGPWTVEKKFWDPSDEFNIGWADVCTADLATGIATVDTVESSQITIRDRKDTDDPTAEANSHLISSAPDLYEALAELILARFDETDEPFPELTNAFKALAKARGEQP